MEADRAALPPTGGPGKPRQNDRRHVSALFYAAACNCTWNRCPPPMATREACARSWRWQAAEVRQVPEGNRRPTRDSTRLEAPSASQNCRNRFCDPCFDPNFWQPWETFYYFYPVNYSDCLQQAARSARSNDASLRLRCGKRSTG